MNRFSTQSKAGSDDHSQAVFAFDSGSHSRKSISTARLPDVINWQFFSILNLGKVDVDQSSIGQSAVPGRRSVVNCGMESSSLLNCSECADPDDTQSKGCTTLSLSQSDLWISTLSFGVTENGDINGENSFYNCLNDLHCKLVDAINGPLTEEFLINFRCAVDQIEQHGRQLVNANTEMKPTVDKHIRLVRESLKQAELVYEKTNQRHGGDQRSQDSMFILKDVRCWLKNVERQFDTFSKKLSHCDDYDTLAAERKEFQEFFCQFIEEGAFMFRDARRQLLQSVEISAINRRLFDCLKSRWLAMRLRCVERDCLYENALKRFKVDMSSSVASSLYELEPKAKKCRNDSSDVVGPSRDLLALSAGLFFEEEVDVGYSSGTSARSHRTSNSAGVDLSHALRENFSQTWPRRANKRSCCASSKPPLHIISKSTPALALLQQQQQVPLQDSVNLMSANVLKIHHNIRNCCTQDVDENSKFSACLCLACQQNGDDCLSNSLPTDQWMLSIDAEFESDVDDESHHNFHSNSEESVLLNKRVVIHHSTPTTWTEEHNPFRSVCFKDAVNNDDAPHLITPSRDMHRMMSTDAKKTTTLSSNAPRCWKKQHKQVAQCHPFESVGAKQCLLDDDESVMTDTLHQRVTVSKAFSEEEKFQAFVAQLSVLLFRAKSLLHTSSNEDTSPSAENAATTTTNNSVTAKTDEASICRAFLSFILLFSSRLAEFKSTLERSDDDVSKVTNSLRDWQLAFFEFVRRSTGSRDAVESMLVELVRLVSYLKQLIVLVQSNEEAICNEEILKLKAFNSNALQTMLTEAQKMREECGFDIVANGKADFNFDENQAYSYSSVSDSRSTSPFDPDDQQHNDDAALVDRDGIQWFTSALCSNWQFPICLALLTCLVIYVLEPPECCSYRNVWERSLALQMHYVGDGIPPT
ncbi:hypothetical protein T11_15763 [Trichinella zimbabwensis]|uniref:KASH domain-containing protein n=1 Tax=Trichinella zimbabwensis TaxID=268475 RepID=A0A0V1HRM0_9BILA|nr:hypothetical protein T11_15763 [Trichinella zimbabwensis]KRZ12277.1 hypothetical protein T11_15763 [Trichinella zimbabwensis]